MSDGLNDSAKRFKQMVENEKIKEHLKNTDPNFSKILKEINFFDFLEVKIEKLRKKYSELRKMVYEAIKKEIEKTL